MRQLVSYKWYFLFSQTKEIKGFFALGILLGLLIGIIVAVVLILLLIMCCDKGKLAPSYLVRNELIFLFVLNIVKALILSLSYNYFIKKVSDLIP